MLNEKMTMKRMKKIMTISIMTILSVAMFATVKPIETEASVVTSHTEQQVKASTNKKVYDKLVMVYMIGSDLETEDQSAVDDIKEMVQTKFGANNRIVVQTGGAKKWHSVNGVKIDSKMLQRYVIDDGHFELVESLENDNMGRANVLKDFILFAEKNYPAKETSLVLWSHGAGPHYGFGTDENFNQDGLTLEELQSAFNGTKKLKNIVFDACLMGNLETAYALAPYTDYMLASSDFAPGSGINYTPYLNILKTKSMANFTDSDLSKITIGEHDTLSVVDLSKVKSLMQAVAKEIKDATEEQIFEAAKKAIAYGVLEDEETYYDTFDVKGIVDALGDDYNTMNKLEGAIVANYTSEGYKGASGLSIYVPMKDEFGAFEADVNMDEIKLPAGYLNKILKLAKTADSNIKLNVPEKVMDEMMFDFDDYTDEDYGEDDFFLEEDEYYDQDSISDEEISENDFYDMSIIDYIYYTLFLIYDDYDYDESYE